MKILLFLFLCMLPFAFGELKVGFYSSSCPNAEKIVTQIVQKHFLIDSSITGGFLRMHFHDCFVKGCDASILIDPKNNKGSSEKQAGPNQTVRGFEIIDEIKSALEKVCPGIVSCADIITLATRDSVGLANGPKYPVPTGRRDGLISDPNLVNLPGPSISVSGALQAFSLKNFTLTEMVTLLGAHTVGFAHCGFFQDRLSGSGSDPTMDPAFNANLTQACRIGNNPKVFLDQSTPSAFDTGFYNQILNRKGVLQIDQNLALDASSRPMVTNFARNVVGFKQNFATAIVKMGSLDVLVGKAGEIRKNCRAFNKRP